MKDSEMKKIVVIASSTGGPKALHQVVSGLDKNLDAPVVIVQHMPAGFTASLADRLNRIGGISVSEVVNGEKLEKGHVYLAKGGVHLEITRDAKGNLVFRENTMDPIGGLRPCANVTYKSLCTVDMDYIVCAVLTGMGNDGTEGITKLKEKKKIYTIAQDEKTCVVYGMPRMIVMNGLADSVLPLEGIGKEITKKVGVR